MKGIETMKNQIMEALTNKGYNVELTTISKNNVDQEAFLISINDSLKATMYLDKYIADGDTVESATNKIIAGYEANKMPEMDFSRIAERDYIMDHLTIGLQQTTHEDIVKKPTDFDGIEQYLMVSDTHQGFSYKVKQGLLDAARIDLDDAWTIALETVKATSVLTNINKMLVNMGIPEETLSGIDLPISVLTNHSNTKGASAVLDPGAINKFAIQYGCDKVYMIPSSIHEVLLVDGNFDGDLDMLTAMCQEVNAEQVDAIEQLGHTAYVIEVGR